MPRHPLFEIAVYFLRLGLLGFGGPLALIAAMQKDLTGPKGWITEDEFARVLALIKAMPGPIAPQVAVHLGRVRGGTAGGLLAGICFVLPAFVMMVVIAAFYSSVESFRWTAPVLFGMQAAALGVIAQSVWALSRPFKREWVFWLVAVLGAVLTALKPSIEPLVILGAGIAGAVFWPMGRRRPVAAAQAGAAEATAAGTAIGSGGSGNSGTSNAGKGSLYALALATFGGVANTATNALGSLALVSLKSGALVFGSGLAIVPLLIHDVVEKHQWLTQAQFLDALAFGQITPGPVVITVTFIGFKVAGFLGALVSTACIFAVPFFNILTWFPWAERKIGASPRAKAFSLFAIAAVVGAIAMTVLKLAAAPQAAGTPAALVAIALAALSLMQLTRVPVWVIIPGAGFVGVILTLF